MPTVTITMIILNCMFTIYYYYYIKYVITIVCMIILLHIITIITILILYGGQGPGNSTPLNSDYA